MNRVERAMAHVEANYPATPAGAAAWDVYVEVASKLGELPATAEDLLWVRHAGLSMMKHGRLPTPRSFACYRLASMACEPKAVEA
jgi:hypothetical protein